MDDDSRPSPSHGVIGVALLTAGYSLYRLITGIYAPVGKPGFVAGVGSILVAYLLVRGRLAGWIGALVLYALLLGDRLLGVTVFGPEGVPTVVVPVAVLAYLLFARDQFRVPPTDDAAADGDVSSKAD